MMKIHGKKRTKELLAILGIIGTLIPAVAAISFRADVSMERGKVKSVSILVGQLAKANQDCK